MSDLDDLEGGDSPITASPNKIKRGGLILKLLFLLYWQNLAAFVLTLILIFFALFVFTMKLPSKAEFIRFPLFLLLNLFLTFLMVYELVFALERMSVSRWTPAFYFLFDMKRGLFCFMYYTSNYGYWVLYTRSTISIHNNQFYVASTLAILVAASSIWILKNLSLKHLARQFHAHDYFDKIKELIDLEYLLQTLLLGTTIVKFHTISDAVRNTSKVDNLVSRAMRKFTKGVATDIQETDLLSFMSKEDVAQLLKLLEAHETKTITQTSLKNWIETICKKREDLVDLLTHTSAAIKDLNNIIDMSMLPILTPLWFLFVGFKTRVLLTVLGLSATWLALCVPTSKIIQEGVLSAFRRRQFDIGDYCIIDNQEVIIIYHVSKLLC